MLKSLVRFQQAPVDAPHSKETDQVGLGDCRSRHLPLGIMVPMNTVSVSAAVSAIVTVLVGTLMNWGERIVTLFRQHATPDHIPLSSGHGWSSTQSASG